MIRLVAERKGCMKMSNCVVVSAFVTGFCVLRGYFVIQVYHLSMPREFGTQKLLFYLDQHKSPILLSNQLLRFIDATNDCRKLIYTNTVLFVCFTINDSTA